MDLTSTFTALLPRGSGRHRGADTHKHSKHGNTWRHTYSSDAPAPVPPPRNRYTWRSCLCSKFNYPLIDTSRGYLRCRHELWFPRGALVPLYVPTERAQTPLLPTQCIFAWLTHTYTPKQTHLHPSTPAPAHGCSRGVLINRQSVKNNSLKSLKGFTPALWLAGKENPMNS